MVCCLSLDCVGLGPWPVSNTLLCSPSMNYPVQEFNCPKHFSIVPATPLPLLYTIGIQGYVWNTNSSEISDYVRSGSFVTRLVLWSSWLLWRQASWQLSASTLFCFLLRGPQGGQVLPAGVSPTSLARSFRAGSPASQTCWHHSPSPPPDLLL